MNSELQLFVREALARGLSRDAIRKQLFVEFWKHGAGRTCFAFRVRKKRTP
jgi:hypothetical protein